MKKIYVSPKIEIKHFSRQDVADVNMIVSCSPAADLDYCFDCDKEHSPEEICPFQ